MAEKKFNVKPVSVHYVCDECGEGMMKVSGSIIMMYDPPHWPHTCEKCGAKKTLPDKYPTVRFELIDHIE